MGIKTFAAIDIGSYNVRMDIYEMSQRTCERVSGG